MIFADSTAVSLPRVSYLSQAAIHQQLNDPPLFVLLVYLDSEE